MTNMTTGEFWNKVTVLMNVFDGRVTAGPMSLNQMLRENRHPLDGYCHGQIAEFQLHNPTDYEAVHKHADKLDLWIQMDDDKHPVFSIRPKV